MATNEEDKKPQFELREDGEIHLNKKGKSTLLAKYDEDTGILTFETFAIDQKYRTQICRAVMEDWETGELKGNAIKAYAIHGRPVDQRQKGEPLPPKKDKMLGDKTPEFVKWLYRWRRQAFYARYGVHLDSNGEPQTASYIRIEQGLLKPQGAKPLEIGDRAVEALGQTVIEKDDWIIAERATCLTVTRKELAGSEHGDDQDDEEPMAGGGKRTIQVEDDDVEPTPEPVPAKAPKAKAKSRKAKLVECTESDDS